VGACAKFSRSARNTRRAARPRAQLPPGRSGQVSAYHGKRRSGPGFPGNPGGTQISQISCQMSSFGLPRETPARPGVSRESRGEPRFPRFPARCRVSAYHGKRRPGRGFPGNPGGNPDFPPGTRFRARFPVGKPLSGSDFPLGAQFPGQEPAREAVSRPDFPNSPSGTPFPGQISRWEASFRVRNRPGKPFPGQISRWEPSFRVRIGRFPVRNPVSRSVFPSGTPFPGQISRWEASFRVRKVTFPVRNRPGRPFPG
jgi:hypothetical protein